MDTSILRLANRIDNRYGGRYWETPIGRVNMLGTGGGLWAGAMSVSWPDPEGGGRRAVRVDWHKAIAKAELRKLFLAVTVANRDNVKATVRDAFGLYPADKEVGQ